MARYLLIESRDPFESQDSAHFSAIVEGLASRGNDTALFLLQNAVLSTRKGTKQSQTLADLMKKNVKVLADGFSLRERAIKDVVDGVEKADMGRLVDILMEPGTKAVWH